MTAKEKIQLILLIDDDVDEHELFSLALKDYGSNIHCVATRSCCEANDFIRSEKPSIIFLDMNMPGTNGLDCLSRLKKNASLHAVPVYMYSTSRDTAQISSALTR